MKNTRIFSSLAAAAILAAGTFATAQSVIVNEMSQGSGGNKEWVELLVVDDGVNMQDWELGDNDDGTWHEVLAFTNDGAWASVAKGTLIVIYNGDDVDETIAGEDTDFSDHVVMIPHTNTTYFTDAASGWGGSGVYANSDSDDTAAIRDASDTIIHDMAGAHPTADVPAPGSGNAKGFLGDTVAETADDANWSSYGSSSATPGAGNGGDNTTWIASLTGGSVTLSIAQAYSVDADTIRVRFNANPASTPGTGDFTIADSGSASLTVTAVTEVIGGTYDLDLSGSLTADTQADTVTYTPESSTSNEFIGGLTSISDIRTGSVADGALVTVSVAVTATDGDNDGAVQERSPSDPANTGIFLRDAKVADLAVNEDVVLAAVTGSYTDSGNSTRPQLSNLIIISQTAGAVVAPTVVTAADFESTTAEGQNPAEQYEALLLRINSLTVTAAPDTYGEVTLSSGANTIVADDMFFDYVTENSFTVSADYDLIGIGYSSFGAYKVLPRSAADILSQTTAVENWTVFY